MFVAKSPDKELREQIAPFCEEPVEKGTLPLDTALCEAHGLKSAGKSVVWIIAPLATSTESLFGAQLYVALSKH